MDRLRLLKLITSYKNSRRKRKRKKVRIKLKSKIPRHQKSHKSRMRDKNLRMLNQFNN